MQLDVYQTDGNTTGRSVELDAHVFDIEPNDHVLWLDVRRIQASNRQGTHKTKERGEIKTSGRKIYRQKGTGMSRAGNRSSPLRRGGGRTFGPRPRKYGLRLSRKTRNLARRSALTYKAKAEAIRLVEALDFSEPNTVRLVALLDVLDLRDRNVLVVTENNKTAVYRSSRNLARVDVREARCVSTEDILRATMLVCEENAVQVIVELLSTEQIS